MTQTALYAPYPSLIDPHIMPRFGERLKRWLDHVGMNYKEFDHVAGLTSEYTSKLVRGKVRGGIDTPTHETRKIILSALSKLVKEPMTDILFATGPRLDGHAANPIALAPTLEEILRSETPITYEGVELSRDERDWALTQIALLRRMQRKHSS